MSVRCSSKNSIAVVVSAHGLGHAARSSAVIQALARLRPELEFHILTTVPRWFFADSLSCRFKMQRLVTDVGVVQRNALVEDLKATERRLHRVFADASGVLDRLTRRIDRLGCRMVICDIAPLGIAAAGRLGLPSVLVENFTCDWIYRGYRDAPPGLRAHADAMSRLFSAADLHIQTEPWCRRQVGAEVVSPVARLPRTGTSELRSRLGVPKGSPMVLLTMGGLSWDFGGMERLSDHPVARYVIPGGGQETARRGRLLLLPFRSDFYHPDLVAASDVVVGKLGYSTVAETHRSGASMAFVGRSRFRESVVMADYVRRNISSVEITGSSLNDGSWLDSIDELLEAPRRQGSPSDGADQAARIILDRFGSVVN
jgi:hypothetical protein